MSLLKRLLLCLILNLWCISAAAEAGETHHGVANYQFTLCPEGVPRLNAAAMNGKALGRATVHAVQDGTVVHGGLIAHGVARSAPLHEQVPPCSLTTVGSAIRAAEVDTVVRHSSTRKVGLLRWVQRSDGVEKRLILPVDASAALNGTTVDVLPLPAGGRMQRRVHRMSDGVRRPAADGDDDGFLAASGPESAGGEMLPRVGDHPSNALGDGWDAHPPAGIAFFPFVQVGLQLDNLNCSVLSASGRTLDAARPACSPPPAFPAATIVTAELSSDLRFHWTVLRPRSSDSVAALIMMVLANRVAGRSGRGRRSAVLAVAVILQCAAECVAAAPWTEARSNCTNDPNMPKRFRCHPRY